ncbi:hypothetical protein Pyn_13730 [Prunus yedoensis var. nudiflora]|uniref:Tryptophan synthase beta chain-like PALP domain-containing protein n=1 Tax=Prunus yedoensis var. nudiflora TaxID=2094558 RepID=A0A314XVH3_PRUYE|nr:hypothetical protein Pyn_13730 [Prunus yedoensis var. nudiflora]
MREVKYAADISSIREAEARIKPFIHQTPVLSSESLNALAGRQLFFKCECFQKGGAFKFRGLDDDHAVKGVVTHSSLWDYHLILSSKFSGNHAAALSLAAKLRGIPAYIVIPKNAPKCKVENVIRYGGQLIWSEPTMQSRESTAAKVLQETGAVLLHPYNDRRIISGQGTISLEFLEHQVPQLDTIIVPISGGGLISGVALAAKAINPAIRVLAAEPEGANDAAQYKAAGRIITLSETNTDYDCVHTVFTLPLGNCILDFDLGYLLGIRDQSGGFEVDNGHTGKEENFCKVYGQELESLRALLLSPRAHSKGLGAIDMLVSFPIIGEFYVGGLPIQQQ